MHLLGRIGSSPGASIALLGLFSAALISGCAPAPADSITLQIDGKAVVFREVALKLHGVGGKQEALSLSAREKKSGIQTLFDIDLQLPGAELRKGTYSARELSTHEERPGVGQSDSLSSQLITGSTRKVYWSQRGARDDAGDYVLEITSLTDTRVSARFDGPFEEDGHVIRISGQFDLPYEYLEQAGW